MHITLTQSDIKRIIKDAEYAIEVLQLSIEERTTSLADLKDAFKEEQDEIKERTELVQYLKYNVKLNARDGKK